MQVDTRILKATVLESDDIDAAVEFILTEVLEQPSTGKVDERLAKDLISGTSAATSNKSSAEGKSVKRNPVRVQNAFDLNGDMFNVSGSSAESGNFHLFGPKALGSDKAVEGSKLPAPESLPIDIPIGIGMSRTTEQKQEQESFTYDNALKSSCENLLIY